MSKRTYYDILELPRKAQLDDIKQAYRRLARRYHPDQNPEDESAEDRFKAVVEAYRVLSDAQLRADYDRFGVAPPGAAFNNVPATVGPGVVDTVRDLARAARRRMRSRQGVDVKMSVELSFEAAALGSTRVLELPRRGADGKLAARRLAFDLPPGLADGQIVRWPGEGAPGVERGKSGDLYLTIKVTPHPLYGRSGTDVVADLPLTILELNDGAVINVPTLFGARRLQVPANATVGDELRLEGLGIPVRVPGDAVFRVCLHAPNLESPGAREAARDAYADTPSRPPAFAAALLDAQMVADD